MTLQDLGNAEAIRLSQRQAGRLKLLSVPELIDLRIVQFLRMVDIKEGCWEWKGARFIKTDRHLTYGKSNLFGYGTTAHRMAYLVFRNEIPDGMDVLHHCDNPICCNPYHLFLGNDSDNQQDALSKGRHKCGMLKGESHGGSKLTEDNIKTIRQMRLDGLKLKEIGDAFGITYQNVFRIVKNISWKHVTQQ